MTTAEARTQPRFARTYGVLTALGAILAAMVLMVPQADAASQKRVVAISPFAAQAMVQMGVKPIAIGQTIGGARRLPAALRNTRKLKLTHPNGPNLEVLAKLRPDIVFSSTRWEKGTAGMQRLGIRVVYVDPIRITGSNNIRAAVTKIGGVLGRQKQARQLNANITRQVGSARRGIRGSREKVLVVLGIGNTAMAFLNNSWGGQIVENAGGRLVTGGATNSGGFARLSDEVVVAENPDRIIVVPHGNADDLSQVANYILENEAWQTTNAVKDRKVFVSTDNALLQAGTDVGKIIRNVRTNWLQNW